VVVTKLRHGRGGRHAKREARRCSRRGNPFRASH
jgi:hypothetical protein